jgi:hypothetical protein
MEKPLAVSVSGANPLFWRVETDVPWLDCVPSSGSGNGTIAVRVNSAGLNPGKYGGRILIQCPGAANSPQSVSVTLTIRERRESRRSEFKSKFDK